MRIFRFGKLLPFLLLSGPSVQLCKARCSGAGGDGLAPEVVDDGDGAPTLVEQRWDGVGADGLIDHSIQVRWSPPGSIIPDTHAFILSQWGTLNVRSTGNDKDTVDRTLLDMDDDVFSWHDRGMNSFAIDPDYGVAGDNYFVYIIYTGQPDTPFPDDQCGRNADAGDAREFCGAPGVLQRFIMEPIFDGDDVVGYEDLVPDTVLIKDWFSSSPTHHMGSIEFLSGDGSMLLSSGEGAQADGAIDTGFSYDPASIDDGDEDRPQGSFRAQRMDFLHGKVLRILGGALRSTSELVLGEDFYIVAIGLRNPFRLTQHPETGVVYIGDVGSSGSEAREEINAMPNPEGATEVLANFGWPCMEGVQPHTGFQAFVEDAPDSPEVATCKSIYDGDLPLYTPPVYHYRDTREEPFDPAFPNACQPNGNPASGAISALAVLPETGPLASQLGGVLMFADYAKLCAVYFERKANGDPDFTKAHVLHEGEQFVDIRVAPDGLAYLAVTSGSNHGVMVVTSAQGVLPPVAGLETNIKPANIETGGELMFDASSSFTSSLTDDIETYSFDFDGDREEDQVSDSATGSFTYDEPGVYLASVTVRTREGGLHCVELGVVVGVDFQVEMDPPSGEWSVGDEVTYELSVITPGGGGVALDIEPEDITWSMRTRHCEFDACAGASRCHNHAGVVNAPRFGLTGSFNPLPHELPSSVSLTASFNIMGTEVVREFETTARIRAFEISSTPVIGVAFRAGEAGEVCPHSNPPCTIEVMDGNNMALSLDSRLQADSEGVWELDRWEMTQEGGGGAEEFTGLVLSSPVAGDGEVKAHFEQLDVTRDSDDLDQVVLAAAEEEGFERIRVRWAAVEGATHYIIYLQTTTALGHAHLPTSSYARGTVVPFTSTTDSLVVPDGVYDMEVTVAAFNYDDLTVGPLSEPEVVSMTSSDNTCVNNSPECDYTTVLCTTEVRERDQANGLGAFYDLYCLEDESHPGCDNNLGSGCRLCYTDRCAWSDSIGGDEPEDAPDCPPCVAEAYGVAQPTDSCETEDGLVLLSQTGGPDDDSSDGPQTVSPTSAPTEAPTQSPTEAPTPSPTEDATFAPTEGPTEAPTPSPDSSFEPTEAPTEAPTPSPDGSYAPTEAPTEAPTPSPDGSVLTSTLTEAPTESPTPSPDSTVLTSAPTLAPTYTTTIRFPTASPTTTEGFEDGEGGNGTPSPTPAPEATDEEEQGGGDRGVGGGNDDDQDEERSEDPVDTQGGDGGSSGGAFGQSKGAFIATVAVSSVAGVVLLGALLNYKVLPALGAGSKSGGAAAGAASAAPATTAV